MTHLIVKEKLVVELEFNVEHEFTDEMRTWVAKRVGWALVDYEIRAALAGAPPICPGEANGYIKSATVSAADVVEHKITYEEVW